MSGQRNRFILKFNLAWRRFVRDAAFRSRLEFLRKIFLFEGLPHRAVALLAGKMMEKAYLAGDILFQEGDVGRACFITAEGRVEIVKTGPSGREEVLAVMEPGDFFGEMTLLDELPRSATARAVEPARLYILYKSHIDDLLKDSPRTAARLLHNLSRLLSARLRRQNLRGTGGASVRNAPPTDAP